MTPVSRTIVMVVLAVATYTAATAARGQTSRASGELSGVVTTTDEPGRPVSQVVVKLTAVGTTGVSAAWWERTIAEFPATLTDDQGRFRFAELPVGRYRVSAAKPAFLTTEFGALRPNEPGTAVAVGDGAPISDIAIRLARGAVISGVLRAPDGMPAVNASVLATVAGARGSLTGATTDDRGVYRIFGLAAGEYLVSSWLIGSFSPGEQSTSVTTADVDAALAALERRFGTGGRGVGAGAPTPAFPAAPQGRGAAPPPFRALQTGPTFYPGTPDQAAAIAIKVNGGETRDNVDFQFVLAGTFDVTGVVRLVDGAPAHGAVVSIALGRTTTTSADGSFRIAGVSPGRQALSARVTPLSVALASGQSLNSAAMEAASSQGATLWALEDVFVPAGGLSNLSVTLRPGMTLAGRIAFDATSQTPPTDFTSVQVRVVATAPAGRPTIARDGAFEVRGIVPGPVQISGTVADAAPPGWWLRSAMLNGRDMLDTPIEFGAGTGDVSGVVLTFSDRHTEIAGRLETPAGLPATSYVVAVLPADRQLWHPQSRRLAFTRPATDGQFSFRDLPPGAYALVALTDLDPATWREAAFLEQLAGAGVRVTLGEAGRVLQNLRIAR